MEKKINKKSRFSEILRNHPETIEVLLESGMHCVGCPMAMGETIEQGALAHGMDPEELVKKINKELKK